MKLPSRAHHRERTGSVGKKDQMNISGWAEMTNREEAARSLRELELVAAGKPYPRGAFCCLSWGCSLVPSFSESFWGNGMFPKQLAGEIWGVAGRGRGVSPPLPWLPSESGVPCQERWLTRDWQKEPSLLLSIRLFAKPDTCFCFCFWLVLLIFWSFVAKKVGSFASSGVNPFHYFYLLRIKYGLLKATWFNTKKEKN